MTRPNVAMAARIRLVLVAGMLVSCTQARPPQTVPPSPGSAPLTNGASATPILHAPISSASPPPTQTPTGQPPRTPSPSTVSPSPQAADWPFEPVKDFPTNGDWIASIAAGGPGFVAVGASQPEFPDFNPACEGDIDARAWTSPDGLHWTNRPIDIRDIRLTKVVEFRGLLYAFGRPGARCNMSGDRGWSAWSSADGVTWARAATGVGAPYGHVYDVVVSQSRLIALGWNDRKAAVWVSEDGSNWSAESAPRSFATRGASLGRTVVGSIYSDDSVAGLLLAVSYDEGETWQEISVDLGMYEHDRVSPKFATGNGTLVVGTRACCVLGREVGVPITTSDGHTWSVGPTIASPADDVVALPHGFMALNGQDGRTHLSPDGQSWFEGPTLPSVKGVIFEMVAAGPLGVVIVPIGAGIRARYVRFAPAAGLDPADWTTPAQVVATN